METGPGEKAIAASGYQLSKWVCERILTSAAEKGLKLSKEQLYSINKPSLKDAIVIFGGGCTGEMVSQQGLVFTNHHCGYSVIAGASTMEHNYLRDGFYARNQGEEIPGGSLSVTFLMRIDDVTSQVLDSLKGLSGQERATRQGQVLSRHG